MSTKQDLDRLHISQYIGPQNGDTITLHQTHANGSDTVVGSVELRGDEIEDAIYLLTRAKARRDADI